MDVRIYFIRGQSTGHIKIGRTSHSIENRLAQLQAHSPDKLEVIAVIEASSKLESRLHDHFQSAHLHGEWFKPTPELLSWIDYAVRTYPAPKKTSYLRVTATADEREQLRRFRVFASERYRGPFVIVENPDGSRNVECGLPSAEATLVYYERKSNNPT